MKNYVFTLIRDAGRLAFYSLIAGPALLLYVIAMWAVLNGSPSQQFLDVSRSLTDGAPDGRVMQCVSVKPSSHVVMPVEENDMAVAPDMPPPLSLCHMTPVDSQFWTRQTDFLLFNLWLMAALCGAAMAYFLNLRRSRKTDVSPDMFALHKKD